MRSMKDIISRMETKIKTKSRKGYQAITRTFAQLRGRIGTKVKSVARESGRSKGGGRG